MTSRSETGSSEPDDSVVAKAPVVVRNGKKPAQYDDTPDYTDSDTNPNTTASSIAGDFPNDGRKRRIEANQLRKSVLGKKHDRLGESKVGCYIIFHSFETNADSSFRISIWSIDLNIFSV